MSSLWELCAPAIKQEAAQPPGTEGAFTVPRFSHLTDPKLSSECFTAGNCSWNFVMFPLGNTGKEGRCRHNAALSLYLNVPDTEAAPRRRSRSVTFRLTVVNHLKPEQSVTKEAKAKFDANIMDWGFSNFMKVTDVRDPKNGFLINDTLTIRAFVTNVVSNSDQQQSPRTQLRWVGDPRKDPQAGLGMQASHHREFYSAIAKGQDVIAVGNDAEVVVLGEQLPRVARIEALWSERPVDNQERMLARCRFYYRPSETTFMGSGKLDELFASDHVDHRVAASSLLRKCTVVCGHPSRSAAVLDRRSSLGAHNYFCMYYYDHQGGALQPVPAT